MSKQIGDKELSGVNLNFAIAERVMGWTRGRRYGNGNGEWIVPGRDDKAPLYWSQTPRFSECIEAAMQVIEKMRESELFIVMMNLEGWNVHFVTVNAQRNRTLQFHSDSLPEAICRAALAAIED
jgi:hypothetical protein